MEKIGTNYTIHKNAIYFLSGVRRYGHPIHVWNVLFLNITSECLVQHRLHNNIMFSNSLECNSSIEEENRTSVTASSNRIVTSNSTIALHAHSLVRLSIHRLFLVNYLVECS